MKPDQLDNASELEEQQRQAAISNVLNQPTLPKTGFCLWCNEPTISSEQSFCDADCAGDYHKAARMKGR